MVSDSLSNLLQACRRTTACAAATLVLAGLLAYGNSLSVPFIFDDLHAIVENPSIRHFWSWTSFLPPPGGSGVSGRPLVSLSLALNYALGGLDVRGYHATNLALHICAALALFGLVRRTIALFASGAAAASTALALAITLIWEVHPLETESVTCVIQRNEVMMGLFYLLTLYCFVRFAGGGRRSWGLLSVVACLLGMASKEVMVTAPLIVLLYDRTFVTASWAEAWRRRRRYHLSLAATWLLLAALLVHQGGSRGGAAGFGLGITPWTYALTQCRAVVHYLRLAFWPRPLILDYGTQVVTRAKEVAAQAFFLALLGAGAVWGLLRPNHHSPTALDKSGRAFGFAGAWFFVILAPSSSVVPLVTQTMAEHRMYLPLAAVVAVAVIAIHAVAGWRSFPVLLAAAAGLGLLTVGRNQTYHNAVSIWGETLARFPRSPRAQLALANALMENPGSRSEAIVHYEEALRLKPDYAEAHYDLALALAIDPATRSEAMAQFEAALRLQPDYAEAHNNLGILLSEEPGRLTEAMAHYQEALRLRPDSAETHNNLGNLLAKSLGRPSEAIVHYEEALRLKPDYAEARSSLAHVHNRMAFALVKIPGRLPEAVSHFKAVVGLNQNSPAAHYNLAIALAGSPGGLPEAVTNFEVAVRLRPDFVAAHNNLALAYADLGRRDEAIRQLEIVLKLDPSFENARRNLRKLQTPADASHY